MPPTGSWGHEARERELAFKTIKLAAAHREIGLFLAGDFDLMLVRLLIGPAEPKVIARALGDVNSDRLRPRLVGWLRKEEFNQYFRRSDHDDTYFLTLRGQRRARGIVNGLNQKGLLGS